MSTSCTESSAKTTRGSERRASGARRASELAQCETRYPLELARGASYLANTLSFATLGTAIAETVDDFVKLHGDEFLPAFLELLSRRLSERKKPEAASAIRFLMNCGRPPSADELRALWSSVGAMAYS